MRSVNHEARASALISSWSRSSRRGCALGAVHNTRLRNLNRESDGSQCVRAGRHAGCCTLGALLADADDCPPTIRTLPRVHSTGAYGCVPPVLAEGSVLSDTYRVIRRLAEGAMGAVYEAEHLRVGRRVAIKVLRDEFRKNPEALVRFRREAETIGRLQNPHIVQVFDVHETPHGAPYFVMEFLQGESLAERLFRERRFPMARALALASQIASALASAHAQGVVHRDLKPDNIFLVNVPDQPPFVKILDFGIATAQDGRGRVTNEHTALGTPEYMAPEQALAGREIDHRADQFALAVVVYEMAAGFPPFRGDDPMAVLYQVVHEDCKPLHVAASWVPAVFDDVIGRALSKKPDDRFATISQFAWALENAARNVGVNETQKAIPKARVPGHKVTPKGGLLSSVAPPVPDVSPTEAAPDADRPAPEPSESATPPSAHDEEEHERYRARAKHLFEEATQASKQGRHDDAVYAAERLFDLAMHHRDAETYEMMARVVPTLNRIFESRLGTLDTMLVCTPLDPRRLNLTPSAASLIEHVDGGATVGHVLSACGIPRRDAVRMLAGLLRRGALRSGAAH